MVSKGVLRCRRSIYSRPRRWLRSPRQPAFQCRAKPTRKHPRRRRRLGRARSAKTATPPAAAASRCAAASSMTSIPTTGIYRQTMAAARTCAGRSLACRAVLLNIGVTKSISCSAPGPAKPARRRRPRCACAKPTRRPPSRSALHVWRVKPIAARSSPPWPAAAPALTTSWSMTPFLNTRAISTRS